MRRTQGNTALHLAITNRHHATLKELLKAGADVRVCNDETYPPLHVAALVGDVQVGANGSLPIGIELERARATGVSWESQGVGVCPTVGTCRRDASAWSISNSTPCGDARAQSNSACSSDTAFFPSGTTSPPLIMSVVGGEATVRSRTRADGVDTVG